MADDKIKMPFSCCPTDIVITLNSEEGISN